MTQQTMLFEPHREPLAAPPSAAAESERGKREGMERAAMAGAALLGIAREYAHDLAMENGGECDADMVALAMAEAGYPPLGNSAGMLFQDGNWVFTGRRVKSTRSQSHANELKVWRWKHGSN